MDLNEWNVSFFLKSEADCLNYIKENYLSIPYLNVNSTDSISNNALVRFRGMVQDMYDPEFYYEKCETINTVTSERLSKSGKYSDTIDCKDNEIIDMESNENISSERHTFIVISTPGLNNWVNEIEENKYKITRTSEPGCSKNQSTKRPLENDESEDNLMEVDPNTNKKKCNGANAQPPSNTLSKEHHLNFPIPGETGKTCHVKIYQSSNVKLNEVYDFVGFLSGDIQTVTSSDDFDNEMEIQTHNPPISLIPRIHCIYWNKVESVNPLVESISLSKDTTMFLKNAVHFVLTGMLMGDELAANYLLYHLLSKVYLRKELMPLGSFTLNLSNIPTRTIDQYGSKLYEILEMLLPKSYYLPMTLKNMNELSFTPKKDYNCNRLTSGLLQLSAGTHLVLDETKLSAGKLNESGVKAVSSISNIINCQKVPYDFSYYSMEFESDIPILILSEGKSLLPSDCRVDLKPTDTHPFDEIGDVVKKYLNPSLLNDIRAYLTMCKNHQYDISDNMLDIIQNDFVNMRQAQKINAENLHQLLVLSRLICISEGKSALDEQSWKTACELENCRRARIHL